MIFFLSKETFFNKNRWYLLCTPFLSFLIPLIKISTFKKAVSQEYMVYLPDIVLSPEKVIQETEIYQSVNDVNYVGILFWVGVAVFSILFLVKLFKIIHLIRKHQVVKRAFFTLVLIPEQTKAFSFFNFIFLGKEIPTSQQNQIIAHELVHTKQKHSLDLLLLELLKIIMWFNPMIYFYQKRITLVHEYLSDSITAKSNTKEEYINNLLSSFFEVENISFVNQFYKQSFIKKRIIMMKKNQSKKMNQLKYLVLIPVLISMFFYTSCAESKTSSKKELQTLYRINNGKLVKFKGNRLSYLDNYLGGKDLNEGVEISFEELSKEEQNELKNDNNSYLEGSEQKFYKMPNGRNVEALIIKGLVFDGKVDVDLKEVSFLKMNKVPNFIECEERDLDCFFEKLETHFYANFDKTILKDIFLSPGKKKILTSFNIDTNGKIVDVEVKSPHIVIKEEIVRVFNTLPKMSGGKSLGTPMKAKYTLPFILSIE